MKFFWKKFSGMVFFILLFFPSGLKAEEFSLPRWVHQYYLSSPDQQKEILSLLEKEIPHPSLSLLQNAFSTTAPLPPSERFTFSMEGKEIHFFVPPSARKGKAPLLFLLHPMGESSLSILNKWEELARKGGWILASRTSLSGEWWQEDPLPWQRMVFHLRQKIPFSALFIGGEKEGASGALFWALRSPQLWSGVIALDGFLLEENGNFDEKFLKNAQALPIWMANSRPLPLIFQKIFQECKEGKFPLHIQEGNIDLPGMEKDLIAWVSAQQEKIPMAFSFTIDRKIFSPLYYLDFPEITERIEGSLEIKGQEIHLQGKERKTFKIYLHEKLLSPQKEVALFWSEKKILSQVPRTLSWKEILDLSSKYTLHPGYIFTHVIEVSSSSSQKQEWKLLLKDPSPIIRWKSIREIRMKGLGEFIPEIEECLKKDPHSDVRQEAALAMGKMGASPSPLFQALRDPSFMVRQSALRALSFYQEKSWLKAAILQSLSDPHPEVRGEALRMISFLGPFPPLADLLPKMILDPSPYVRRECACLLGDLKYKEGISLLQHLLSDKDWTVRESALSALGKIPEPSCLPLLQAMLSDPHPQVRRRARKAAHQLQLILKGIDPLQISLIHNKAEAELNNQEWKKAKDFYLQILKLDPEDPLALYNMACLETREKQVERALRYLIRALLSGFDNLALVKTDSDLELLRRRPEYTEILKAAEKEDFSSLIRKLEKEAPPEKEKLEKNQLPKKKPKPSTEEIY